MLINKTKNIVISKDVRYCRNIFSKAKGLMFSRKIDKPLIFLFSKEKRVSIHMFFVFFPIDVIYLNKNKEVIYIKENAKPFTLLRAINCNYIIEIEEGGAERYKIEKGDIVKFD